MVWTLDNTLQLLWNCAVSKCISSDK